MGGDGIPILTVPGLGHEEGNSRKERRDKVEFHNRAGGPYAPSQKACGALQRLRRVWAAIEIERRTKIRLFGRCYYMAGKLGRSPRKMNES